MLEPHAEGIDVEFANQAGQYDEVEHFLRSRETRKLRELQDS